MTILLSPIGKVLPTLRNPFLLLLTFLLLTIGNIFASVAPAKSASRAFSNNIASDSALKDKISAGNAHEIAYQAVLAVQTFESVLNSITFNDNTATELQGYINNSFAPGQRARGFYANNVIIEDDLDPKFDLGKTRDVTAERYLKDLDLVYEKTEDQSIKFSNFAVSDIKRTNYIYVNIKFDETFQSKYKADGAPYPLRHRVAEVRAEKSGKKKWEAFIVAVRYYDPADPIDNAVDAVPVVNSDTVATPIVIKEADVENAMVELVKNQMADTRKNNIGLQMMWQAVTRFSKPGNTGMRLNFTQKWKV